MAKLNNYVVSLYCGDTYLDVYGSVDEDDPTVGHVGGIDIEDGQQNHKRTIRKIDPNDILLVADGDERPKDDTMSTAIHVQKQSRD